MKTSVPLKLTMPSDREIAWSHEFNAPREMVFDAFTKPEFLRRWLLGPDGWSMIVCDVDLKVGGTYRYLWRHTNGEEMGMRGVYREVARPERTVSAETFDNPWSDGESIVTAVFTEHAGKTTVATTVRYNSQAIRDGVLKSQMEKGVAASYDRLAEVLASTV
jgi:uncharacterized protein YndB with AHSA1/START domain